MGGCPNLPGSRGVQEAWPPRASRRYQTGRIRRPRSRLLQRHHRRDVAIYQIAEESRWRSVCRHAVYPGGRRPSLKIRTFPDYLATQLMHKMKAAEPSSKSGGLVARMMRPPPSFSISYVRVGSFVDIRSDRSD